MIIRVILATILAAAVLFLWGYLFWQVLPLGSAAIDEEPFGGAALIENMKTVLPTEGVYFMPFPATGTSTDAEKEKIAERFRTGPLVRIFYRLRGADPYDTAILIRGFLHNLAIALLISIILASAAPALPTYTQRLGVVCLITAVAAIWLGLNEAIWFYHPWKFELYQAGYVLVGGLFMGIVIAAIVKSKAVPVPAV